jgi:DNA-binding transcriptional LysR family regulator
MNISALIYFFSIAQGDTFLNAAENNSISQSSLSKAIQRLEDDLGVQLFDRSLRSAKLTPAGITLFEWLKRMALPYREIMEQMSQFSQIKTINCCAIPMFSICKLNKIISEFAEQNPNIVVHQHTETDIPRAMGKLVDKEYDFIILHRPIGDYGEIDYTFLTDDRMLAIFPKNHKLATRKAVVVPELLEQSSKIILDACMSNVVTDLMPAIGAIPHNATKELIRRQDMLAEVSSGGGVSLYFSDDVSVFKLNNVVAVPVSDVPYQPLVIASSRKISLSKEKLAFRQYIATSIEHISTADGI